jgi:hypothetical protein
MAAKKTSKFYAFDESTNRSTPTKQMFVVRLLEDESIEDIGIYKKFEDAESELIKYLKKGTCCWIVSNNE